MRRSRLGRLAPVALGFTVLLPLLPSSTGVASAAATITEFQIPAGTCPDSSVCVPIGISNGPDGKVWVVTNAQSEVLKFNTSGTLLNAYTSGITPFSGLFHIHPGPDGRMWFTELGGGPPPFPPGIGAITTSGAVTEIATNTPNSGPLDIRPNPTGTQMDFTENSAGNIGRLNLTPPYQQTQTVIGPNTAPGDIIAGVAGDMWFTETGGNAIVAIKPDGSQMRNCYGAVFCPFPVTAGSEPEGIAFGGDGNMWFTEHSAGKIGRLDPFSGIVTEYPLPDQVHADPGSMVAGPPGDPNLYFDVEGRRGALPAIGRINPSTHVITEYTTGISSGAILANLTVGPDNKIWFTEPNLDKIARLSLT